MPDSESNRELVRSAYVAFNRGDIPAVLDRMDEDVRWQEMEGLPHGGINRGPEAVVENVFQTIQEEWEVWQANPDEFIESGDTIVVLGQYIARCRATETDVQSPFAHVWRLRQGRIQSFRQYTDTAVIRAAMEAPSPARAES